MADWLRRVSKIFSNDTPAAQAPASPPPSAQPPVQAKPVANTTTSFPGVFGPETLPDLHSELFDWMLDFPHGPDRAADESEKAWLAALDPLIAADKGKGELLPRAAGLIPSLLNSLRDESQSSGELAQRVAKDANLVAEVTRLANSPSYRASEPVSELADAIRHVGTAGVRQAIAKVVLKPMFDAQNKGLSGRAASRMWLHSQAQADLCRAVATTRGLDPFNAYLGGLLCGVGWTAGLRALDRVFEQRPPASTPVFSRGFKEGFRERRDRLFVQFLTAWRLNNDLHEAARNVQHTGSFAASTNPLVQVMLIGERLATLRLLAPPDLDEAALLAAWPDGVRAVYEGVARSG